MAAMDRHFPETVMIALKDATVKVFYKKEDMRSLLQRCGVRNEVVSAQDWSKYKFHILSPIVDDLNIEPEGIGPLRRILQETLAFKNCDHLLWLTDGKQKKKDAEDAVRRLEQVVEEHDIARRSAEEAREARQKRRDEAKRGQMFRSKLDTLQQEYLKYLGDTDRQKTGYGLEDLLYQLFELFELNPHGPFRRTGEQIDGAFVMAGDHFLLEAKWQARPVDLSDLRDLDGAVGSSLDNTLGLFVSITGFTKPALDGYSQGNRPRLVCMDGADLMIVFEGRIELPDLLRRKLEIAAQKRAVFTPAIHILQGRY